MNVMYIIPLYDYFLHRFDIPFLKKKEKQNHSLKNLHSMQQEKKFNAMSGAKVNLCCWFMVGPDEQRSSEDL